MAEAIDPRWAWEPYRPSAQSPWDLRKVGHLHRRAAFSARWSDLAAAVQDGPDKTIDKLLRGEPGQKELDDQVAVWAQSTIQANNGGQAREWPLYRMMHSLHPLREKMTLFWHNHFATSNAKVANAGHMLGQYDLLTRHSLGNFRALLQDISKDPAMLVWLDTSLSKKNMPNENYARELMELFSLGIGNYTEKDIREAARAFTGWSIKNGQAVYDPSQHDDGVKHVLGQPGKWQGSDIVRICLEQKAAPYFILGKLYRFLVSETVPATPELLEPLAELFRKSDYDIGEVVSRILRSNLFFSPLVYRTRVKSPVDFVMGIVRPLEGRFGTTALAQVLETLGQNLLYPPSVKGWDGGQNWLNGQTLLFRQNLALSMTTTTDTRFGEPANPAKLARKHGKKTDAEVLEFFLNLFLQGDVPAEARASLVDYQRKARGQSVPVYWTADYADEHRIRALCHLVLTLPEYQLD